MFRLSLKFLTKWRMWMQLLTWKCLEDLASVEWPYSYFNCNLNNKVTQCIPGWQYWRNDDVCKQCVCEQSLISGICQLHVCAPIKDCVATRSICLIGINWERFYALQSSDVMTGCPVTKSRLIVKAREAFPIAGDPHCPANFPDKLHAQSMQKWTTAVSQCQNDMCRLLLILDFLANFSSVKVVLGAFLSLLHPLKVSSHLLCCLSPSSLPLHSSLLLASSCTYTRLA